MRNNISELAKSKKAKNFFGNLLTYLLLIALSVVFLMPFFYMISKSLMQPSDDYNQAIKWLPRTLNFDNYKYAFDTMDYTRRLFISMSVSIVSTFAQVVTCSFVAYGIARTGLKIGNGVFALILFTLIIPPQTVIVPQYILFSKFGMLDSYLPVIVPCFFAMGINGGMIIFIFKQFFSGMPKELENAAMIDGAGYFGCFFRIILPNSKSAMLVTAILSFVWQWNNSFEPSIYIRDASKQAGLVLYLKYAWGNAAQQNTTFNQCIDVTATFLAIAPVIIIFLILQKQFMQGVETSGLAN